MISQWFLAAAGGVRPCILERSGATNSYDAEAAHLGTAIVRNHFDTDGLQRKFISTSSGGNTTSDGQWISCAPQSGIGTGNYVRLATHDTGTNRYVGTPTIGTWTEITGTITFDWNFAPGAGPAGPDVSTYTFELSDDGGSTVVESWTATIDLEILSP